MLAAARLPGVARGIVGFLAFGLFWGAWGAVLPAIQLHANADDGDLGIALLFVGAGALVFMRVAGSLLDRWEPHGVPLTLLAFAPCAFLPALAQSPVALGMTLVLVGGLSGAIDVAVNAEAVGAEEHAEAPVLNLVHAMFSIGVVVASIATGVARAAGADEMAVLGAAAVLTLIAAVVAWRLPPAPPVERSDRPRAGLLHVPGPLALLGALVAIAFFIESAWQSWSAVLLETTLQTTAGIAALGPALFAVGAAVGRLAGQRLTAYVADRPLVMGGAVLAGAGSLLGALAPTPALVLLGVLGAGLGTSVCAPVLFSLAGRLDHPLDRASAISIVTTIAYLGFMVGPAVVGLIADVTSLRAALATSAGAGVLLAAMMARSPTATPMRRSSA